jgi:hypothetical protein
MLLTDQDEISNLYRGPSIDASYQVSVHAPYSIHILIAFLAHLAKGKVSFCHHLASVVR